MPRLLLIALFGALLSSCSSASFAWRDKTYELPEEALRDQRQELDRLVAEVAPALEEDRLGGACLLVLPSQKGLRASWYANQAPDQEGNQFFEIRKAQNEAKARAAALERAGIFGAVELRESLVPGAEPIGSKDWLVYASPDPGTRALQWGVSARSRGRSQALSDDIRALDRQRLDRFVSALSAAGLAARADQSGGSDLPVGWRHFELPFGEEWGFRIGFPVQPQRPKIEENQETRIWDVRGDFDKIELFVLAMQARPGKSFNEASLPALQDRLREINRTTVILDEDRSRDDGLIERWVLMERSDNGVPILLKILQSRRWLVAAGAAGAVITEGQALRPNEIASKSLAPGRKLWEIIDKPLRPFLDSMKIKD